MQRNLFILESLETRERKEEERVRAGFQRRRRNSLGIVIERNR